MWLLMALACTPDSNFTEIEDTEVETVYPSGVPDIFVQQEAVDFGVIPETGESHKPLTIKNQGGGRLTIYDITVRNSTAIGVDSEDDFFLDAGETLDISLVWTPAGEWPLSSTLEVKSNDPDEHIVEVPCDGEIAE